MPATSRRLSANPRRHARRLFHALFGPDEGTRPMASDNLHAPRERLTKEIARLETLEADFQGKVTDKSANIKKVQNEF